MALIKIFFKPFPLSSFLFLFHLLFFSSSFVFFFPLALSTSTLFNFLLSSYFLFFSFLFLFHKKNVQRHLILGRLIKIVIFTISVNKDISCTLIYFLERPKTFSTISWEEMWTECCQIKSFQTRDLGKIDNKNNKKNCQKLLLFNNKKMF